MTKTEAGGPSVTERTAAGAGWIIAWRVATRNIGLVSTLILVRLLQPADFGLVALATGIINTIDAVSSIGVQDALVRAPDLDRDMYDTGFGLSVVRGLLTALVIAVIAWPLGAFFGDGRLTVVMLALAVGSLITAFENIGIIDFRRDVAFRKEFDMQLWSRVVSAATTIAVAVIWRSYWALVAGILTYRLVRLLQSYVMSPYRPRVAFGAWRRIIGFSMWTWASTMLAQIQGPSESMVIGRMLGTMQVGVYAVGLELGLLPTTELVEPLGRALFSGFASLHNASQGLAKMFQGAVGTGLMLVLPAGVGISLVADPMVRLSLGEQWLAAVPVVQILAIGATTTIFIHAAATLIVAIGRPKVTFWFSVAATVVKLTALLLLVPRFGVTGAAVAWVGSSLVNALMLLGYALPHAGVSVKQVLACVIRPAIATLAMTGLLWQLGMAWTPSTGADAFGFGMDAAARSATGALCYAAVLLGVWYGAGRPDGAERFTLTTMRSFWLRLRRVIAV
jgi:O-antigen/teichoic acid export membrane protein